VAVGAAAGGRLLINQSTDMLRTKRRWSVPKIMQIGSGIVKMWRQRYLRRFLAHREQTHCSDARAN